MSSQSALFGHTLKCCRDVERVVMLVLALCTLTYVFVLLALTARSRRVFPFPQRLWFVTAIMEFAFSLKVLNAVALVVFGDSWERSERGWLAQELYFYLLLTIVPLLYLYRLVHVHLANRAAVLSKLISSSNAITEEQGRLLAWSRWVRRPEALFVFIVAGAFIAVIALLVQLVVKGESLAFYTDPDPDEVNRRRQSFSAVANAISLFLLTPCVVLACLQRGFPDDGFLIRSELRWTGWSVLGSIATYVLYEASPWRTSGILGQAFIMLVLVEMTTFMLLIPLRESNLYVRSLGQHRGDGFAHCLLIPGLQAALRAFLCSEFTVENLDFMEAVTSIRVQQDPRAHALRTFNLFVKEGAHLEVNISSPMRKAVAKAISSGDWTPETVFQQAYDEIFHLVAVDCFPRFKKTKEFAEVCAQGALLPKLAQPFVDPPGVQARQTAGSQSGARAPSGWMALLLPAAALVAAPPAGPVSPVGATSSQSWAVTI